MCANCSDYIDACDKSECGALPPIRDDGTRRFRYLRSYYLGEVPCQHIRAKHEDTCPVQGGNSCTYEGRCDPDHPDHQW